MIVVSRPPFFGDLLGDELDIDWDSPPCTPECPCPRCQQADAEEAALLEYERRLVA